MSSFTTTLNPQACGESELHFSLAIRNINLLQRFQIAGYYHSIPTFGERKVIALQQK